MKTITLLAALTLAACAAVPKGPGIVSMPGPEKSHNAYVADDAACRARADLASQREQSKARQEAARTFAITSTVGGLDAALGGYGRGAVIGLDGRPMIARRSGWMDQQNAELIAQREYDRAYAYCMDERGNVVPIMGAIRHREEVAARAAAYRAGQ